MIAGGEKCYKVMHMLGREPWIYENPCTPQEKVTEQKQKEDEKKTWQTQRDLGNIERGNAERYAMLQRQCEKIFGPTACNR